MANEFITALRADMGSEPYSDYPTGLAASLPPAVSTTTVPAIAGGGLLKGIRMPHGANTSVYHLFHVPAVTVTNGFSIELVVAAPTNSRRGDYSATVAYFGVTIGKVTSGTSTVDDTVFASGCAEGVFLRRS